MNSTAAAAETSGVTDTPYTTFRGTKQKLVVVEHYMRCGSVRCMHMLSCIQKLKPASWITNVLISSHQLRYDVQHSGDVFNLW